MGADIRIDIDGEVGGEAVGTIHVRHRDHCSTTIEAAEVPSLIDELPVLAARAALGCRLEVSGAAELRVKESDRITALISGFRAMGVEAEERPDGFVIDGGAAAGGRHGRRGGRSSARHGVHARRARIDRAVGRHRRGRGRRVLSGIRARICERLTE